MVLVGESWGSPSDGVVGLAAFDALLQSTTMEDGGGGEECWEGWILFALAWGLQDADCACSSIATAAAVDSAPDTEVTGELFGAEALAEMSFEGDEMDMVRVFYS